MHENDNITSELESELSDDTAVFEPEYSGEPANGSSDENYRLPTLTLSGNTLESLPQKSGKRYRFLRTIGFGGMKSVLLVYDRELRRNVAMATMPDWRERQPAVVNRFIMEARITARLEHPNIVPVHDIGRDMNGTPYFTMKYLKGHTLASIIRKLKAGDPETVATHPLTKLLRIYLRICNAIAFAHSQGFIHLDLKPENIHVGEFGEVQVIDWGLARAINRPEDEGKIKPQKNNGSSECTTSITGMTRDGIAKGTPGFMAPEQAAGKNREKDQRTDIYTLGCILYTILTFEKPLAGRKVKEVLRATIKGNIRAPRELENPQWPIPIALEAICLKAMERFPENRYQSVYELRQDIIAFSSGYATKAEDAGTLKKFALFIQRNALVVVIILLLVVLIAIFFLLFIGTATGTLVINHGA